MSDPGMVGPVSPKHFTQILANNQAFVDWLSPLDHGELSALIAAASYARQIDEGQGVLIAFTSDADYESENLSWLRDRFECEACLLCNFIYIDRVIISARAQGKGYGRILYADLEKFAQAQNCSRLVCEVNTKPDNPGSHRFHEKLGFHSVGEVSVGDKGKHVRYYEKYLLGV